MISMLGNLPPGISAETLCNYLPAEELRIELKGTHKRNAYSDVLGVSYGESGSVTVELSRNSLYDILPEALFHPIDRFENIPANEYRERFAEEYEKQQTEEANARKFFAPLDVCLFALSRELKRIKDERFSDNSFLGNVICDSLPEKVMKNRFVRKMLPFIPLCPRLRGDRTLLSIVLRKILMDEGIGLSPVTCKRTYTDEEPDYNCCLDGPEGSDGYYLGNEFAENVIEYELAYWNEEECNESFLSFISEMNVFEDFINDFFMGIETAIRFRIGTTALPARLSDDLSYNYLDYNTNL